MACDFHCDYYERGGAQRWLACASLGVEGADHSQHTNTQKVTPSTRHSHLAHVTLASFKCSRTCNAYRAHRHGSESPYPGSTPGLNPCNHLTWLVGGPWRTHRYNTYIQARKNDPSQAKFSFRHRGHRTGVHTGANSTQEFNTACPHAAARSLSRFPPVSKKCKNRVPPNIVFRSRYSTVRVPAIVTHLPRAPSFRRPPSSRRGEALWEQVWRQARVRWGRPLLSRPRGAFGSGHLRIEPACLCDPCARERPCVPCVSRVCPSSPRGCLFTAPGQDPAGSGGPGGPAFPVPPGPSWLPPVVSQ